MTYDVVWPLSPKGVEQQMLAPRLPSLDGATVGFLWDYLFRGDEIFPVLADALRARYPGLTIVDWDVFGNTHGPDEAEIIAGLPERLAGHRVDAVVSAMGC